MNSFIYTLVAGLIFAFGDKFGFAHDVGKVKERSILGEGPYWDEGHQRLYYVDMRNMWVNSYDPVTEDLFKAEVVSDKKPVTLVIRVKDSEDLFVIGLKGSLALMRWDGRSNVKVTPHHLLDVEQATSDSRCNDGKVDPSNRLWVGTMGKQTKSDPNGNEFEKDKGKMFRIDNKGETIKNTELISNMQIPNGLEWSLDKKKFYLVDSLTAIITEYEYNDQDGTICKPKEVYNLKTEGLVSAPNSLPDGMTIDSKGRLWVAVYGTGKVITIDPQRRQKVFEFKLENVLQPTSVCFGGKNLDILFVTTARVDWTDEFEKEHPLSGHLFKVTNLGDVKGAEPSRPVKLDKSLINKVCKS